ncbi:ATP-binding cassette domain-containing protein [Halanaerobacter jeridensis]|uniref:Iron complex transport system ATP-binding protein n=1 Tax=Halanaerobacter jeridensis TaxID=706427 RepID=A0A938XVL0_9FIRM|nr:iron complex transport system ATP-binding protein [Halanaerobacter jeridensis]
MKLEIDGVHFNYQSQSVLEDVNFKLDHGEVLALIGPNGSGKSTLLKCINRILKPQVGSILIDGDITTDYHQQEMAKCVGYVPQEESKNFPTSVFETVMMGRKPYINFKAQDEDLEIVAAIIDELGLEDIAQRNINQLSGGQQQKVLVGRALAQQPEVLLLDEPTSNLDLKHQLEILNLIQAQIKDNISSVIALHDLSLAARYSDKIIILKDGKIFAAGGLEVLTPENLEAVYEVEVSVADVGGRKVIIPERPI